eukprot:gene7760-15877_t
MPHLIFCDRYWRVASDEFSIPSSCAMAGRLIWSGLLCATVLLTYPKLASCYDGWIILFYLCLSIISFWLSVICEGCLLTISLKGTIVDTDARSSLSTYLILHIALTLLQFFCAIFGSFDSEVDNILLGIVVVSQLVDILGSLCCCLLFSAQRVDRKLRYMEHARGDIGGVGSFAGAMVGWESRCRTICKSVQMCTCNLFGGSNVEGFEAVAKIFTAFFHHDGFLDVVPSDVVAGLVLVRLQQRVASEKMIAMARTTGGQQQGDTEGYGGVHYEKLAKDATTATTPYNNNNNTLHQRRVDNTNTNTNTNTMTMMTMTTVVRGDRHRPLRSQFQRSAGLRRLSAMSPADKELMEEIAHYAVFAMASYSLLMLMYVRPCTGMCGACGEGVCGGGTACCAKKNNAFTLDDNICGLHEGAVKQFLRNRKAEVVHASFSNDVAAKPYVIVIDHERQNIVISVRGTLSLEDCITDVVAEPKWGFDGDGRFAHGGMLNSAMWIRRDLEKHQTLSNLMATHPPEARTPLNLPLGLIVVGHSLGAGTAAILAMMLKPAYPRLRCYAFGCPGSIMDAKTSEDCKPFVTTLCLGNDLVCRLSVRSLAAMREQVLDAISRAKVNKMVVMQALFKEYVNQVDDLLYEPGTEPDSPFARSTTAYSLNMRDRAPELCPTPLHVAGRIIYLAKTDDEHRCCSSRTIYTPMEANLDYLDEILVSPTMLLDHFPDRYANEFERIVQGWKESSATPPPPPAPYSIADSRFSD